MESMDLAGNLYEDNKAAGKKDEFPQYYLSLFDNEVRVHTVLSFSMINIYLDHA